MRVKAWCIRGPAYKVSVGASFTHVDAPALSLSIIIFFNTFPIPMPSALDCPKQSVDFASRSFP